MYKLRISIYRSIATICALLLIILLAHLDDTKGMPYDLRSTDGLEMLYHMNSFLVFSVCIKKLY